MNFNIQSHQEKYECGKYSYEKTPEPICDQRGGIDQNIKINGKFHKKFYGWNLIDYLHCSRSENLVQQSKTFTISNSRTVVVSDVHRMMSQREKDVKNVKPGDYHLYIYQLPEKTGTGELEQNTLFYIALHMDYRKEDIKSLEWICQGTFNTDVANGGLYDKRYYHDPNELKDIPKVTVPPGPGVDCIERKNQWNECKKYNISVDGMVILPHGFYVSTCGDGGFRYWTTKNEKNQVVGFGFRHC